jgi:hypothetical protein
MGKRILILWLGFWLLQFCGLAVAGEAQANLSPKTSDPYLWDFGKAKAGELLKHDFVFKNGSSDILEIVNIHTSCGCTASEAGKKSLMPQDSTTITVTFNTKGYSGPVKQFVYVHTDSADLSIVKFTVKAEVIKE